MSTKDIIRFSGYDWKVKNTSRPSGPGDNLFSPNNVWVDDKGLHLAIRQVNGQWYCASVSTVETVGYGRYIFYLSDRFDKLDENLVLGMFVYEHDKHEIDIELRRREDHNGVFIVQGGESHKFKSKLEGAHTTHRFKWEPGRVSFQSIHGHHRNPPTEAHLISSFDTTLNVPTTTKETVHVNFWVRKGRTPKRATEIVIKKFEFIPFEEEAKSDRSPTQREIVLIIFVIVAFMLLFVLSNEFRALVMVLIGLAVIQIFRDMKRRNAVVPAQKDDDPEGLRRPDDEEDDSGVGT